MMKRFLSIIEQDIAIWGLSGPEFKTILLEGLLAKKLYWCLVGLTEDDLIDAWVTGFRTVMPTLDAELNPYQVISISKDAWIYKNPNALVKL